jgi:AraC-like DNA-binding protein
MIINYCRKHQPVGYQFKTDAYDQFQVIAVRDGVLRYRFPNRRGSVVNGGVLVLPYDAGFTLSCPGEGYTGLGLFVRGESGMVTSVLRGDARFLDLDKTSLSLRDYLLAELTDPSPGCDETASRAAELLLQMIIGGIDMEETPRSESGYWAEKVARAIEGSIRSQQDVVECLNGLGLGYRQLSRHFSEIHGKSPKRYQMECRLRESKRLLLETRMSMSDIAFELGFSSQQHFSIAFKKEYVLPPREYRNNR